MQNTHASVNSIAALVPGNGNAAAPFSPQRVVLTTQAYSARTWKANDRQTQHARSVEREAALTMGAGITESVG